jgi:uncharacterized protein YdaU (DUF1376 family)
MHYYQFNIGDYSARTAHLSPIEDLAYRRMIDLYVKNESPLPKKVEEIARLTRLRGNEDSIKIVLDDFFKLTKIGWVDDSIQEIVDKYKEKSEKAKKSAKARWEKEPSNSEKNGDANALRTHCERNANHKPLTINQEPLTNNHKPETKNQEPEHKTPCSLPAHDVLDDHNSHTDYYDKPPFSPDDISTKALEHRFDEFWSNYPVKKSKADAHKKWMKIKPDQNLLDTMIKALQDQTEEKAAQKKLEGFAPNWKNPSTWLNQKCWEDEIYIPEQPKQRKSALENYYDDKPKKIHPSMEGLGDEIGRRPGETPTQYWHRLERAKAKLRESRAEGYSVPMGSNDKDTRGFLDRPNGFN